MTRKVWDSVRDPGPPYPPVHFIHLALAGLFFGLACSNAVPSSLLLPPQGAALVFGVYFAVTRDSSLIRLSTCVLGVTLTLSVSRLPGLQEAVYLLLPVGALSFLLLPVWASAAILLLASFSAWFLPETASQRNLLLLGLSLCFFPMVWTGVRNRRKHLRLERRIHHLEGRDTASETRIAAPPVGPTLSEEQFSGILRSVTDIQETVHHIMELAGKALRCHTLALYRTCDERLQLEHHVSEATVPLRESLSGDLAALIRTHPKTSVFSLRGLEGEQPTIYVEPLRDPATSILIAPLMEGHVVTGALIADSLLEGFDEHHKRLMTSVAGHLASQWNRNAMIMELGNAARASAAMVETSRLLLGNIRMAELPDRLLQACRLLVEAPFLAYFSIRGGRFKLRASVGFESEKQGEFSGKDTILGWIQRHGAKYHISDLSTRPVDVLPYPVHGLRTFLGLPLIYDDRCQGVLMAGSDQADGLSARDLHMLETAVLQAATAMANASLHSRIEKMALTDGLTGLYNHQNFRTLMEQHFERLGRYPEPLSVLLLDIDHFKKINDTWGHPAGDAVLRGVASIIRKTLRKIDIPARYGGEEFAVVLVRADGRGALEMAERLRANIAGHRFRADSGEIQVTVSIGVATFPDDARDKDVLVELADKALYESKNSGRNRTTRISDLVPG